MSNSMHGRPASAPREQAVELVELRTSLMRGVTGLALGDRVQHARAAARRCILAAPAARSRIWKSILLHSALAARQPVGVRRLAAALDQAGAAHQRARGSGSCAATWCSASSAWRMSSRPAGCLRSQAEHAALEQRALRLQERRQLVLRQGFRLRMRRRRQRQVREEQVLLRNARSCRRRPPASRYTGNRRSGTSAWPRASSPTNSFSASTARSMTSDRGRRRPRRAQAGEAALDRLAEPRRAAQPDHAQRPAHLVQVLGAGAQHRVVLRRGRELGDRCPGPACSARSTSALIQERRVVSAMKPGDLCRRC